MMPELVEVKGLKQTVAALRRLPTELSGKNGGPVRSSLFQSAKLMRDEAKQKAPVDSGNLKQNIILVRDRNPRAKGQSEIYYVTVRKGKRLRIGRTSFNRQSGRLAGAYYAHFVEFGTEKQTAQPFMRPAFEAQKREAVKVFGDTLRKRVDAAARKAAKL